MLEGSHFNEIKQLNNMITAAYLTANLVWYPFSEEKMPPLSEFLIDEDKKPESKEEQMKKQFEKMRMWATAFAAPPK